MTVSFGVASDTATITATGAGSFSYTGTGAAGGSQAGVTAITASDAGANATQALTLNGTGFNITGGLGITGIETVTFATTDLLLAGSTSETGATAVSLNSPGITTTGTQTFANPVTLGNATALSAAGLTMSGTVALGANALTVAGGGTISGVISGTSSVATTGSGTLTLSATNTWTAATAAAAVTVNGGTAVSIAADANLGNAANGITLNGGTLTVTSTGVTSNRHFTLGTGGGTVNTSAAAGGNYTIGATGSITGSTGLTKAGVADLVLANPAALNTPGAINVTAGRLFFAGQNALGSGAVTVASGATLDYTGAALALGNSVTIQSGSNVAARGTGTLTLNGSTVLPTTGTITFDSDDVVTGNAGIAVQTGVTLTGTLTVQVGGNFASVTGNANVGFVDIQGVVNAGANAITKTQPGTLKFSNVSAATPNTMTGAVTVSGGTLEAFSTQAANTDAIGTANVTLSGGNLKLDPVPSTFVGGGAALLGRYFNFGYNGVNATTGTAQADFSGQPAATRTEVAVSGGGLNGGNFNRGITLVTGAGNDTITVQSQFPGAPTAVYTNGGDDTFQMGVNLAGPYRGLTLDGGAGVDTLFVYDQSGGAVMHNRAFAAGLGQIEVSYLLGAESVVGYQNLEFQFTSVDAATSYVQALYNTALGEVASPADLVFWLGVLDHSGRGAVVQGIELSAPARLRVAEGWFQQYLGYTPVLATAQFWADQLRTRGREEVLAAFLATDAYYAHAGGTDQAFAAKLYRDLLNYNASPEQMQAALSSILPLAGRAGLAWLVLTSDEYRALSMGPRFAALRRQPSRAELQFWASAGQDQEQIDTAFYSSYEFFFLGG